MTEAAQLSCSFADELDDLSPSCQMASEVGLHRPNDADSRTVLAASADEACLSHDEAIELLRASRVGIKPDLSQPVYRFAKRAFDPGLLQHNP